MRLPRSEVTGVILAGGRATRLGGFPKGLLEVEGTSLAEQTRDALAAVASRVLMVANDPAPYARLGVPVVKDLTPGLGPIGGLESALAHIDTPWALVVACDMPRVRAEVLACLRDRDPRYDAVVPRTARGLEPLCARWAQRALTTVRARIGAGDNKMTALLGHLVVEEILEEELRKHDPNLELLGNVNTPQDAARLGVRR